jgi:hypothetical protein
VNLNEQINLILFSFVFGIFFNFFLTLNCKFIYSYHKIIKIISSFLFVLINVLIYFIILKKINNGIFHIYSLIIIFITYLLIEKLKKHLPITIYNL